MPKYYVLEMPAWVHIVAVTSENQLVMVRQYRHAADQEFLEIPGGSTDPKSGESELEAAQRELREETGFTSSHWELLNTHFPNPALQNNRMFTFLALNCRQTHSLALDPFEDLQVELRDIHQVIGEMDSGKINHSLMLASLAVARKRLESL